MKYLPDPSKYPKKFFIKSECYELVLTKGMDHFGETDPVDLEIRIKEGMSKSQSLRTLIHELLHAIDFEMNIKLKHKQVYKLEEGIYELLVDNFL